MNDEKARLAFAPPDDRKVKIWRYLDFTKFVSMLENRGLFFSRIDCLEDPFEGSLSRADKESDATQYNPTVLAASAMFTKIYSRKRVMVNCWHMNERESAAMWRLYAKTNEAVSIRSTYENLRKCLDPEIQIGEIHYIDYEIERMRDDHPFSSQFMHKRKSFEHEKELRALFFNESDSELPDGGMWKKVDLHLLIEKIFVAPTSPSWFRDLIKQVITRYELDKPVERSPLDGDPIF